LVPLLLAPLGALAAWRRPGGRFFTVYTVVAAGLHYGLPGAAHIAALPGLALGTNLRLMPHLEFGLCVLGALGVEALACGEAGWGVALVTLQALSVAAPALGYLPRPPARWLYPETPALAWLRTHAGFDRVVMPGHVGLLYGLNEAHGYDGLTPRRIAELVGSVGTGTALVHGYLQN